MAFDLENKNVHQDGDRVDANEGTRIVEEREERDLSRSLKQRHLQMIALAGAIGTGLFLSLGGALQTGGPLGALLGYAYVDAAVCSVQFALGQVSALFPVTSSFARHAEMLVDPALGFAVGYLSIPSEITAALVLIVLKILLVVGIVLKGLVIDLGRVPGQGRIGFRYWNNPRPFIVYLSTGR